MVRSTAGGGSGSPADGDDEPGADGDADVAPEVAAVVLVGVPPLGPAPSSAHAASEAATKATATTHPDLTGPVCASGDYGR